MNRCIVTFDFIFQPTIDSINFKDLDKMVNKLVHFGFFLISRLKTILNFILILLKKRKREKKKKKLMVMFCVYQTT